MSYKYVKTLNNLWKALSFDPTSKPIDSLGRRTRGGGGGVTEDDDLVIET